MQTLPRPPATTTRLTPAAPRKVSRAAPAANEGDSRSAETRFLFGTPGDFFARHQGALLAAIICLIIVGSAL